MVRDRISNRPANLELNLNFDVGCIVPSSHSINIDFYLVIGFVAPQCYAPLSFLQSPNDYLVNSRVATCSGHIISYRLFPQGCLGCKCYADSVQVPYVAPCLNRTYSSSLSFAILKGNYPKIILFRISNEIGKSFFFAPFGRHERHEAHTCIVQSMEGQIRERSFPGAKHLS